MSDDGQLLLTRSEAAFALGISVDTLVRLIKSGELGEVKIGRRTLVLKSDVTALIERNYQRNSK